MISLKLVAFPQLSVLLPDSVGQRGGLTQVTG
jgi:hypothetical protein